MHFTEDPHLGSMIFWVVGVASTAFLAFLAFLCARRRPHPGQETTLHPGRDHYDVLA